MKNGQTAELKSTMENYCGEIILRRKIDNSGDRAVIFTLATSLSTPQLITALTSFNSTLTAGKFDTSSEDAPTVNGGSLIFVQGTDGVIQVLNRSNFSARSLYSLVKGFILQKSMEISN